MGQFPASQDMQRAYQMVLIQARDMHPQMRYSKLFVGIRIRQPLFSIVAQATNWPRMVFHQPRQQLVILCWSHRLFLELRKMEQIWLQVHVGTCLMGTVTARMDTDPCQPIPFKSLNLLRLLRDDLTILLLCLPFSWMSASGPGSKKASSSDSACAI